MVKRNSGFIIGCVLAAGASFFTADVLMSDTVLIKSPAPEASSEDVQQETIAPESTGDRIYETDPFTVTASGSIIKGVETERQTESERQTETDENGNVIETAQTDADGNVINTEGGSVDGQGSGETWTDDGSGNWDGSGSGNGGGSWDGSGSGDGSGSWDGSGSGDGGGSWDGSSYDDGSGSWDGSGSGDGGGSWDGGSGDSGYYEQPVEIQDPGNGDYTYNDGNGSGNSGGGHSDGYGAYTPDEVVLWGISSRYIDESELYNYSAGQLRLIRNEIFALHGRIFRSQDLADYFSQRSWYVPSIDPDEFDAHMFEYLNDYEEANLNVILNYEAALAGN